jgi:hypothetical protein
MDMRWMLTAVIGVVLVAGCGSSGLETGAGTVDDRTTEAFVAATEADWRQQVDTGTSHNLSPDARCYFVTADGRRSLGTMACGPVRRLGSAEGSVWDLIKIEGTAGDDAGLRIPEGEEWQRSVARPAEGRLTRPDDKEPPADADMLALPAAPPAGSRLALVQDQFGSAELTEHREQVVAAAVPAGVRTVRITVTATLTFAAHAYSPYASPRSGTANLGTLTADAVFD